MRYAGRDVADAVVDASVWVSRVLAHDPDHERTVRWFDRQTTEGALHVAPMLLLAEVAGALAQSCAAVKRAVVSPNGWPAFRSFAS